MIHARKDLFQSKFVLLGPAHVTNIFPKKIDWCDDWTKSDAAGLVCRILFRSFMVFCMLIEIFQTTTVNTKKIQDTQGMRLADNNWCDDWTKSDASGLVWIILLWSIIVVYMLVQIFQNTTVNNKQIKDTQGMRFADNDWCNYWTKSDASGLVWMILFWLIMIVCMLLEIFQTTTVNTKQIQDTQGMWLGDDSCKEGSFSK
jgi:competence protein ComGC